MFEISKFEIAFDAEVSVESEVAAEDNNDGGVVNSDDDDDEAEPVHEFKVLLASAITLFISAFCLESVFAC